MFNPRTPEKTGLEKTIDDLTSEMAGVSGDSDEYAKMADQLVKLLKLKSDIGPKRVSPETWANIMANLSGILIIVGYERTHVMASKALGFLKRTG